MDELRLMWQQQQFVKQAKRLKAQIAVAKMVSIMDQRITSRLPRHFAEALQAAV